MKGVVKNLQQQLAAQQQAPQQLQSVLKTQQGSAAQREIVCVSMCALQAQLADWQACQTSGI